MSIVTNLQLEDVNWREEISTFLDDTVGIVDSMHIYAIPMKKQIIVQFRVTALKLPITFKLNINTLTEVRPREIVRFIISKLPENLYTPKNVSEFVENFMNSENNIMFINIDNVRSVGIRTHGEMQCVQVLFKGGNHAETGKIYYKTITDHLESIGRYDLLI